MIVFLLIFCNEPTLYDFRIMTNQQVLKEMLLNRKREEIHYGRIQDNRRIEKVENVIR